jgi:hypothetical protein
MNVFYSLIKSGKIQTRDDLKYYFRTLAKKLHPDSSYTILDDQAFIRLKKDFDESIEIFPEHQIQKETFTRKNFYDALWEIESSGFPINKSIRNISPLYIKRIEYLNKIINQMKIINEYSFLDVERNLYDIRGDNIIDNPLFGTIRMLFYNLITWHLGPKKFTRLALEKWYNQIKDTLIANNYDAFYYFIKWLIDDLNNGAALIRK